MPAYASSPAQTQFTVDRATHSIKIARMLEASPAEAFAAWTEPDQVACWWDPSGKSLSSCEIDLRPGGAFRFVPQGHPDMPFTGTYTEIVPGERLAFDANGAFGRVTFAKAAGGTMLSVEIRCRSAEHLQQFIAIGVQDGTARTLDNLAAHVAAR